MTGRLAGVVAWTLGLVACASSPPGDDDARATPSALLGGGDDAGDAPVVALMRGGVPVCSGTLIAPAAVLTAAHCLTLAPIEAVLVGVAPGEGARELRAARAVLHPDYDPITLRNDVGVLLLAEPAAFVPATLDDAGGVAVGAVVRLVGFGVTDGSTNTGARTKHAGDAVVAQIDDDTITLTPGPAQACTGDSGGAVLAASADEERLIGVVSAGDGACARFTRAARTGAYRASFIEPAIAGGGPAAAASCGIGRASPRGEGATAAIVALSLAVIGAWRASRARSGP